MTPTLTEEELAEEWISDLEYHLNIKNRGDMRTQFELGWRDRMKDGFVVGYKKSQQELERVKREYFKAGQARFKVAEHDGVPVLGMNVYDDVEHYEIIKQSKQKGE